MATTKANELGQLGSKLTVHNENITLDGTVHGQYAGFDSDFTNALSSNISVTGNITVTGTVDGRDVATDGTKLDGIETAATADQTAAEIKTLVGSATDSNVFTDADHTKLDGIETAATADQTKADIEGLGIDVPATNLTGTIPAARLSTATTQAESDDSTKIATTAYVVDKITTLIGGAPSTLNDLNELAAAINDDANYNSTLTTALATKLPLAGGTISGNLNVSGSIAVTDSSQIQLGTGNDMQIYHNGGVGEINCGTGDFTIDAAGDIILDAGGANIILKEGGTAFGELSDNTNGEFDIRCPTNNADIRFKGVDGGANITALRLDMSEGGRAYFANGFKVSDTQKAFFGDGNDLEIYHDGSHSYVKDAGTGNLKIQGENVAIENTSGDLALYYVNTGVNLYHNNSAKLATTSTGIDVTGTVTADGLNVQNGSNAGITFDLTTNYTPVIKGSQSVSDLYLEAVGGGGFRVSTTDKPRLFIQNNGDISFYEDTGVTAKFFWDASAEKLGIGTTPNNKLTLSDGSTSYTGHGGGTYLEVVRGSGADAGIILNKDTGQWMMGIDNSDGTNPPLRFEYSAGGSAHAGLGNGTVGLTLNYQGKVGIGTSSPSAKLDITGFSSGQGLKLYYGNASGSVEAINFGANNGANGVIGMQMVSQGVGDLWLGGSGGRSLTLYRNGNVGIDDNNPSEKLSIGGGSIRIQDVGQYIYFGTNAGVKIGTVSSNSNDLYIGSADDVNMESNYIRFWRGGYYGSTEYGRLAFSDYSWLCTGSGSHKLGIGITNPSEKLHVSGNILATGNITAYSDISLKDNINLIPNALDKVLQLRGVTYNRNDIEDNPRHTGVIAQEVEKVLPEVISESEEGIKSVAYGNMVGLLVEAIKELKAEIEELKGK